MNTNERFTYNESFASGTICDYDYVKNKSIDEAACWQFLTERPLIGKSITRMDAY